VRFDLDTGRDTTRRAARRFHRVSASFLGLAAISTACERGHTAPPESAATPSATPQSAPPAVAAGTPPAIPTSLAHCLQPPYSPSPTEAPAVGRFAHHACDHSRAGSGPGWSPGAGHHVLLGTLALDAAAPDEPTLRALTEKVGAALAASPVFGVGYGLCCSSLLPSGSPAGPAERWCISVSLPLCARPLAELVAGFASLLDETHLTDAAVGLEVSYSGNTGPRCAPTAPDCLPLAYGHATQQLEERRQERLEHGSFALPYDPALPRRVLEHSGAVSLGGVCRHDGECGLAGGNNRCGAWYLPQAPGGSHVEHMQMYDDYCGCVHDRCMWFTPERPKLLLRSELEVQGWGEPPLVDPKRYDVGYGNGQQVVAARLEGPWMQRQLQRCHAGHPQPGAAADRPHTVSFALNIDRRGKVTRREVSSTAENVRPCIDEVFGWLRFPAPHAARGHRGPITVKGTLLVDLLPRIH
jgi:hypothetical protein